MIYLLLFSAAFSWLTYLVGYRLEVCIALGCMLVAGSLLGRKSTRSLQLHGLTLVLMTALALLGGLRGREIFAIQLESTVFAGAYVALAFHNLLQNLRILSFILVIIFWIGIALGLAHAAGEKLGASGIILAAALIAGVAFQDVRKLRHRNSEDGLNHPGDPD